MPKAKPDRSKSRKGGNKINKKVHKKSKKSKKVRIMFDDDTRQKELMGMLNAKNVRRKNFKEMKEEVKREERRFARQERRLQKNVRINKMKVVFENAERILKENKLNFEDGKEIKESMKNKDNEDVDVTIKFL